MCGIFAYVNYGTHKKQGEIVQILVKGLRRLEYRGYDSSGIAIDATPAPDAQAVVIRAVGNINKLQERIDGELSAEYRDAEYNMHVGIAHTRWATHGPPSDRNSHPHRSDPGCDFLVVHNGIITNYKPLKQMLESKGAAFESETDTEVIAKLAKYLFEQHLEMSNAKPSFVSLVCEEGAFACVIKSRQYPGEVVACKRGSPLLVGIVAEASVVTQALQVTPVSGVGWSQHKDIGMSPHESAARAGLQHFSPSPHTAVGKQLLPSIDFVLASDAGAIVEHTRNVVTLEDEDVVHIGPGVFRIVHGGKLTDSSRLIERIDLELDQIRKGNFAHFMLKEIFEQPESLQNTMRGRVRPDRMYDSVTLGGMASHISDVRRSRRLVFVACGTSYNSCVATRPIVEQLCDMPVTLENASDFLDRQCPIFRSDTCVFVSQSGETADTLAALRFAKSSGALCVGVTNTVGSAIARETHCGVHINAGIEIGVASTKAYTSQIVAIVMMALQLGEDRLSVKAMRDEIVADLVRLPELVGEVLKLEPTIKQLAERLYKERHLLLMGRGYQFATCVEGALKIKEIAYLHTEGILAGELKHGPLALVDENIPTMIVCCRDAVFDKTMNAIQQVCARSSRPIIICNRGDEETFNGLAAQVVAVPSITPCLQGVLTIVPLQLLSYHIAVLRGHNVDQPRNLAKSVTVQ